MGIKHSDNKVTKKTVEEFIYDITSLYRQKKIKESLQLTEVALGYFPKNISLLKNASVFAGMLGQLKLAKQYALKSVCLFPKDKGVHNNLNLILEKQKTNKIKEEKYQKILQINPNDVDAYYNLANLFKEQKEFSKAKTLPKSTKD